MNISTIVKVGKRSHQIESFAMSFSDEDMEHITSFHEDVKIILVDYGNSTSVLFLDALLAIAKTKNVLKKVDLPLIEFVGWTTYP